MWMYLVVFLSLLAAELIYFKVAERYGIVDVPNKRSSHTLVVLRGGGIIFPLSVCLWGLLVGVMGGWPLIVDFLPFLAGLILLAITGFVDDKRSLSSTARLLVQFIAIGFMLGSVAHDCEETASISWLCQVLIFIVAMIILVGAVNIINFMDGINGITAGYSLSVLIPLLLLNNMQGMPFVPNSFLGVSILAAVVFSLFNFRPKGKAKCFAGDVGSLSIGFIMLFALSKLIVQTGDVTWFMLLMVYGVDGCLTIVHRIMLHEHLSEAHRKHAYQIMANELGMSHVAVSLLYMSLQLVISLVAIYIIPDTIVARLTYLICVAAVMGLAYIAFMKKFYHLHEEYLRTLHNAQSK